MNEVKDLGPGNRVSEMLSADIGSLVLRTCTNTFHDTALELFADGGDINPMSAGEMHEFLRAPRFDDLACAWLSSMKWQGGL